MIKKMLRTLFILLLSYNAFGQQTFDLSKNSAWPEEITLQVIHDYVDGKKDAALIELKSEYEYILDFLEMAIQVCRENINIGITQYEDIAIQLHPFFFDGVLGFEVERKTILQWDEYKKDYREISHISVVNEIDDAIKRTLEAMTRKE